MAMTKLEDLINPQVLADMISAKLPSMIKILPFAKIDTTLVGRPGNTISVPFYTYIGDAVEVAEGALCETSKLGTDMRDYTVKKIMKAVELTDEALLSGYGNPQGQAVYQITKAIASKMDNDGMDALLTATSVFDGSAAKISYNGVVDAIDVFGEEENSLKVMYINPAQVGTMRKDPNFVGNDKLGANLMVSGAIGKVGNTEIVVSKKAVKFDTWYKFDANGTAVTAETLATVKETLPTAKVGDKVTLVEVPCYFNPIIKLTIDSADTEEETPALTIYMKRDVNVENERHTLKRTTDVSGDEIYTVALTDATKVVLAKFKA